MTSFLLAFAGCHFLLIMFVLSSSVHIQSSLGNFEPSFGFLSYKHGDFLIMMRFISSSDPIHYSIVYEYLHSSNQQVGA